MSVPAGILTSQMMVSWVVVLSDKTPEMKEKRLVGRLELRNRCQPTM